MRARRIRYRAVRLIPALAGEATPRQELAQPRAAPAASAQSF